MFIKNQETKKVFKSKLLTGMLSACVISACSLSAMASGVSLQGQDPSADEFINAFMGGGASSSMANTPEPQTQNTMKYRGISLKKSTPKPQPKPEPVKQMQQEKQSFDQQVAANNSANACLASKQSVAVNINFAPNSTNVTDTTLIKNIARAMNSSQLSSCYFIIEGHTDATGNDYYNLWLSQKRAGQVKNYLSQYNVPQDRLVVVGKGEDELANSANPGSKENRRVVFKVINYK